MCLLMHAFEQWLLLPAGHEFQLPRDSWLNVLPQKRQRSLEQKGLQSMKAFSRKGELKKCQLVGGCGSEKTFDQYFIRGLKRKGFGSWQKIRQTSGVISFKCSFQRVYLFVEFYFFFQFSYLWISSNLLIFC